MGFSEIVKLIKVNRNLLTLLIIGTTIWSLIMVKSGLVYSYGMGFWGPNGHDGVWHIALINHLAQGSFDMPVFAGGMLKNYHIGFDLILAIIHKISQIPVQTLYFQIVPPIFAFLIGWLTYKFVREWKQSKLQALWATFFVYFGGNFGWVVTLARNGQIGGDSMFWSQQSLLTLINPPFALSLVVLLAGLLLLLKLIKRFSVILFILCFLLLGLLVQIKAYSAILVLAGLGFAGMFQFLRQRRFTFLGICVVTLVLSLALLYPLNRQGAKVFVLEPFWFLETLMALQDRLYWPRFFEAMTNYRLGDIWGKMILAYAVAFLIFLVGNLGTRFLGFIELIKYGLQKRLGLIDIFLTTIIFVGILIPMFFLQTGTPWNTIQFFYYSLFVLSIYTGISVANFLERLKGKKLYSITALLIILFTVPTSFATLRHYLPSRPPAKISHNELSALSFLNKQERGVVLTYPFDRYKTSLEVNNPPRSLYVYETTAYVSAFSGQPVYIEDEVNLDITGYNWRPRRKDSERFFDTLDIQVARKFLAENSIRYLYLVPTQSPIVGQRFRLGEGELGLKNIFENKEVVIYQVLDTI